MVYGAKSITRFDSLKDENGNPVFEERVVIVNASNQDEAIELAEIEAKEYAQINNGFYLSWIGVYEAKESKVAFDGIQEVYSIMRNDDSSDEDYLDYFYDTGSERTTNYQREQDSAHQSTTAP